MKSFLDMTLAELANMVRNLKNCETIHECNKPNELAFSANRYALVVNSTSRA